MPLSKNEKLLVEAVDSMLQQDAKLGLVIHDKDHQATGSAERGYEYLHNQIDDMFALRAAELTHAEGINQAFRKVHNYKYLDDPTFPTAMEKELVAQAVPAEERSAATSFISNIIEELKEEQQEWAEKDAGFNPNLNEIIDVSRPGEGQEFSVEEVEDWSMDSNVDWESGDASPGRTP